MDSLPLDTSHPAVRDYLALVRLQVHYLSTIIIIVSLTRPGGTHTTVTADQHCVGRRLCLRDEPLDPKNIEIVPHPGLPPTIRDFGRTLTKGVGLSLVFANWVMALWAIAWVFEWFILATVFQGILLILLLYSNIALLTYHAPTTQRPFDMALIHAPLRFFFVVQFALMLPLNLLCVKLYFQRSYSLTQSSIALGLTYIPLYDGTPANYNDHQWPAFGVVLGTNIITVLIFTALLPLALVASYVRAYLYDRQDSRRVALAGDDHPGLRPTMPSNDSQVQGPREVDPESVWGN
ncbi:unnamed protein product [Mycena citricolor]|uniref:Uncharacterized protein n=1 Tax=Mycena citricolor TaxID=2018698 RepID=A0AAD2H4N1_9AGAR|nr:unnamed protein product [Mycena citricolor]